METKVVKTDLPWNRSIVSITHHGQTTFKIKQGNQFIGKTSNGGYKNLTSAIIFARATKG